MRDLVIVVTRNLTKVKPLSICIAIGSLNTYIHTIKGTKMGDYMRGVEDTLEFVLMLVKECENLKELIEKLEDKLSFVKEGKYIKMKQLFREYFLDSR